MSDQLVRRKRGKGTRKYGRQLRRDSFHRYWTSFRWWRRKTERMARHVSVNPGDLQSVAALKAWKAKPRELTLGTQVRRYGASGVAAWVGGKAQNYAPGK